MVYGADMLTDGATMIAKKFNIPDIIIGLTIVAFGTSMPELAISGYSAYNGNTDVAVGNIVGSNIANILLIIGTTALVHPLIISRTTLYKEIVISIAAAILLFLFINDGFFVSARVNAINSFDGVLLLSCFIGFLMYLYNSSQDELAVQIEDENSSLSQSLVFIILGLIFLVLGGKVFVDEAVAIAINFGMSEIIAGLTIVAIGTSLPELATSVVAAVKGKVDIAIGNVIGSNIFNIFLVLGLTSLIAPLEKGGLKDIDLYVCIGASILLFLFGIILKQRLPRIVGFLFLITYFGYLAHSIMHTN